MQLVSFSSRLSSVSAGGSNNFIDFTTRYGAIREEDRITLRESLLQGMGTYTGLVARMALYHDPLLDPLEEKRQDQKDGITRLPWSSSGDEQATRQRAKENVARLEALAPLLNLTHGDPPLLERPLIALSNGQTRRARILAALCQGSDVLVLEEPFTGLDPPTRASLSKLLASLHAERKPRTVCVLREQDEIPGFITHVLAIGDEGEVLFNGVRPQGVGTAVELARQQASDKGGFKDEESKGGYAILKEQAAQGVGRGDERAEPVVQLSNVSIAYKGKKVLDVSLPAHLLPLSCAHQLVLPFVLAVSLPETPSWIPHGSRRGQWQWQDDSPVPSSRLSPAIIRPARLLPQITRLCTRCTS